MQINLTTESSIKNKPLLKNKNNIQASTNNLKNDKFTIYPSSKLLGVYYIPFKSRVKEVVRGQMLDGLADEVDQFEETHDPKIATELGSGMFAQVYKFNKYPYVIKESFPDQNSKSVNNNFSAEL